MKVALFIDGKNFYSGCRKAAPGVRIDFPALGKWLVERVGGSTLWGAYYYTGVERGERAETEGQQALTGFLDMVELQPGFFVQRFPRKAASFRCQKCGEMNSFTQEKEVDTTMVADMLRLAAVGAFDVMVLLSGDADLAPAVEGVRSLGKQAFVATWGGTGLAPRLRKAAFDHIDLVRGLDRFATPERERGTSGQENGGRESPATLGQVGQVSAGEATCEPAGGSLFLAELRRAEQKFAGRYVGLNYFLTRWESPRLEPSPEIRGRLLDQLTKKGLVEIYQAPDGAKAIRVAP